MLKETEKANPYIASGSEQFVHIFCKMKKGKHDPRRFRIGDFLELSLDILRTAVMPSEIGKIKNNFKC